MSADSVCFVVMPFGRKPLITETGKSTYDFDKVYRVIIQRAVREAGLVPIRADEHVSSALIHTEMFRDLRDQPVVLADLSLDNPNVFYELGIRHVMSPAGTVLMCRKGSILPFDIKLSRVIAYEFDGANLDWEEAERTVRALKNALVEARKGEPDSPVHALLEPVMKPRGNPATGSSRPRPPSEHRLRRYEELLADHWAKAGASLNDLLEHRDNTFGCRALAHYCLRHNELPDGAEGIAHRLEEMEQFSLAVELFEHLQKNGSLSEWGLQKYACAISEANPYLEGATKAISLTSQALKLVEGKLAETGASDWVTGLADCHRRLAGLYMWRWQLTKDEGDLQKAIDGLAGSVLAMDEARAKGNWRAPGLIAQNRIKQLFLLRLRDENPQRHDAEGNAVAIMALEPRQGDREDGVSWLYWFKAIMLADSGSAEAARDLAVRNVAYDATIKDKDGCWQIGRWQYRNLRRFIDQHSRALRDPTAVGKIAQMLQAGEEPA